MAFKQGIQWFGLVRFDSALPTDLQFTIIHFTHHRMERKVYTENICSDCLQSIVNDEQNRDEAEAVKMAETLANWHKTGYVPAGLADNEESFFSWVPCVLCGQKAGDRYEYYFFQNPQ